MEKTNQSAHEEQRWFNLLEITEVGKELLTSLQKTKSVPETIVSDETRILTIRLLVRMLSVTFLGGCLMTSLSTGSTPRLTTEIKRKIIQNVTVTSWQFAREEFRKHTRITSNSLRRKRYTVANCLHVLYVVKLMRTSVWTFWLSIIKSSKFGNIDNVRVI